MDSAIQKAEKEIILGETVVESQRKAGTLETLSGFNEKYDPGVTHYHIPGDPSTDDSFLRKVFHHYYTREKDSKGFQKGRKILTHDFARLAALDVV